MELREDKGFDALQNVFIALQKARESHQKKNNKKSASKP
jgi:hypothetical protein